MTLARLVTIALLLTLAACGGSDRVPPVQDARAANFGDNRPFAWAGRTPQSYPVHGIDVARYQDTIDWSVAQENGVNFAFIKATEGGDRLDPQFQSHWDGAGTAGVARGAYHFYYFCTPAEVQARWFIRNVPKAKGMLPPVLDLEWNPFSPTCTFRPDAATVRREAATFMRMLTAHYGQRPIIYTAPDFYETNDLGQMRGVEFWLRSAAAHPTEKYPNERWTFWQYSATGVVPGARGNIDLNVFASSTEAWTRWLAARQVR
jgi:lysozyme